MLKESRKIVDASEYEDYASELWGNFLFYFTHEDGLIRDVGEDDGFDEDEVQFVYTDKGQRLAERMRDRLVAVGLRHFPKESGIDLSTPMYREL